VILISNADSKMMISMQWSKTHGYIDIFSDTWRHGLKSVYDQVEQRNQAKRWIKEANFDASWKSYEEICNNLVIDVSSLDQITHTHTHSLYLRSIGVKPLDRS
jgi:hypothetical protein